MLKKGKNFIWFENLEQIKINNLGKEELKMKKSNKGIINEKNYNSILKEKFTEIKQKVTVLKIMNNKESLEEMNNLISNIEKYEKEITNNSVENTSFSNNIKKIKDTNFQNQSADELASCLQAIENEISYIKENEDLKKKYKYERIFLMSKM